MHKVFVPERIASDSICTTCVHAPDCMYCSAGSSSIITCDEFQTVNGEMKLPGPKKKDRTEGSALEKDSREFLGLCRNCQKRKSCQYADTETGVWHCEEYQ